ncbi:hypothetical protein DICVIV_10940 [Dictyocaulus viviparus]|uniref:BACK domain-containing protein n=1 Tax=Dictyocaulus viviparus TaxID=29172 RepID=A0A0D8XH68_DICVI|nr:hypothetical protein DICVIV_10940 [Dictyocaulus viviparus]
MLHLDHLEALQTNFTSCGLNIAIEWIYGKKTEISFDELTDALAAAFALEMYDMVECIEKAVLTLCKHRFFMTILLYHLDNFTSVTKKKLIKESASAIQEISVMEPFVNLPPLIFKRIIKRAIKDLSNKQQSPFDIIRAIAVWEAENHFYHDTLSLLKLVPFDDISNDEVIRLHEMANKYGLEKFAKQILSQHCATVSSPVVQRLNYDEGEITNAAVLATEQNVMRESPLEIDRIAAGKNIETKAYKGKAEFNGMKGISWEPTPQEEFAIQKAMENLSERISFGNVMLDKTENNLHVEILYKKTENTTTGEAIKLFFDIEVDYPTSSK